jgi:EpsI family protein
MTMSKVHLKAIVAALLMVASATLANVWRPTQYLTDMRPKIDLELAFPKQFGEWTVDDRVPVQVVSPDAQALLNELYSQVISRVYVDRRGDRIMLSVAYGGDQSEATRAHRPEVCYPAQGFDILSNEIGTVKTAERAIRVRRLVTKRDMRIEPVTYWVIVGDEISLSGTEQKWRQMTYGFKGIIPDGMLVRVSNISSKAGEAYALQDQFIASMASAIPVAVRSRIVGLAPS